MPPQRLNIESIPLAHYRKIAEYEPEIGDYIQIAGWFSTEHGVVTYFDKVGNIHATFEGLPFLLLTLTDAEREKNTRVLKLSDLRVGRPGKYSILQHSVRHNANIWYV